MAAIKPNFLRWPVMLVIAGSRRVALTAVAAWLIFCLIPLVQIGALTGLAARVGIGGAGLLLSAALVVGVAIWMYVRKPPALQASAAALITTLLASPLAWTGYAVLLLPVFVSRRWNILTMCAAGILLIPVGSVLLPVSQASQTAEVIVGSAYTWAWLLLLVSTTNRSPGQS